MIGIKGAKGIYMMDKEKAVDLLSIAFRIIVEKYQMPTYLTKDEERIVNSMVTYVRAAYNRGRSSVAFAVKNVIKDVVG